MKKMVLVFLFTGIFCSAFAKFEFSLSPTAINGMVDNWFPGSVVLNSGDTVKGSISYSALVPGGLVVVFRADGLKTYSPMHVHTFWFYDDKVHREVRFVSLENSIGKLAFFEVLHDNPLWSIVGERTFEVHHTKGVIPMGYMGVLVYDQAYVKKNFKTYVLDVSNWKFHVHDKNILFVLLKDREMELRSFAKKHKLRLNRFEDSAKLIEEYYRLNSLQADLK